MNVFCGWFHFSFLQHAPSLYSTAILSWILINFPSLDFQTINYMWGQLIPYIPHIIIKNFWKFHFPCANVLMNNCWIENNSIISKPSCVTKKVGKTEITYHTIIIWRKEGKVGRKEEREGGRKEGRKEERKKGRLLNLHNILYIIK